MNSGATQFSFSSEVRERVTKYVKGLPLRAFLGGFILAVIWISPSMLQHAYSRGFHIHPMLVLQLLATFVLPLCVLGFLWGWSERLKLEPAIATSAEKFDQAVRGTIGRSKGRLMDPNPSGAPLKYIASAVSSDPTGSKLSWTPGGTPQNL